MVSSDKFNLEPLLIKAIFFDYDGVLTTDKTGSLTTNRYLSHVSGIEFSKIKYAFNPYNIDLNLGKVTYGQIWQEVCGKLGAELSFDLLYRAYESTPLNLSMLTLARKLKNGYKLGIITDNKKDRIDYLKEFQELESLFWPIVVSAEVGSSKNSREIFMRALDQASVVAEESIFIDNNRENLNVPNGLGIKTVFFDDTTNDIEALVKTLNELGVVVEDE